MTRFRVQASERRWRREKVALVQLFYFRRSRWVRVQKYTAQQTVSGCDEPPIDDLAQRSRSWNVVEYRGRRNLHDFRVSCTFGCAESAHDPKICHFSTEILYYSTIKCRNGDFRCTRRRTSGACGADRRGNGGFDMKNPAHLLSKTRKSVEIPPNSRGIRSWTAHGPRSRCKTAGVCLVSLVFCRKCRFGTVICDHFR